MHSSTFCLDQKVQPQVNHDQSPDGSATTPCPQARSCLALRTGTPTVRPALIVDVHRTSAPTLFADERCGRILLHSHPTRS